MASISSERSGPAQPVYRIQTLNRLSFPKGKVHTCEMTGQPATVMLVTPHVTLYYATEEHAEQAWHGIMNKISHIIGSLTKPPAAISTAEERARRDYTIHMSKRALIDLCQQEASKFLVMRRYDLAVPGAIQALKFCQAEFGDGSLEMVPPYLLLSEANLGLGLLRNAEQFLNLANWAVLKNAGCGNAIRSQLHRNFGKLFTAQGKLSEALEELSKDIYCSSLEVGPEHIDTSAGYFLMGNVFYSERKVESALAFYDKVVDIWYKFLASVRHNPALAESFGEAQLSEGLDMLTKIQSVRASLLGDDHIATGECQYTLGLLFMFTGEYENARRELMKAREIYLQKLGAEHASTQDLVMIFNQCEAQAQESSAVFKAATGLPQGDMPVRPTTASRGSDAVLLSCFPHDGSMRMDK